MRVIATRSRTRWAQLVVLSAGVALFTHRLPSLGVHLAEPRLLRALAATAWAPVAWNVFPRLEFRHRLLSSPLAGNRNLAFLLFAAYIVAFSAFRERLFLSALNAGPSLPLTPDTSSILGTSLLAAGVILSGAGFARLRVRGTYMGEYFGFRSPELLTGLPFSVVDDPMYAGSSLMHFGYAIRGRSFVGVYLAVVTGYAYWVAARIFEECVLQAFWFGVFGDWFF